LSSIGIYLENVGWYDIEDNDPKRIIVSVLVAMGAVVDYSGVIRLRKRLALACGATLRQYGELFSVYGFASVFLEKTGGFRCASAAVPFDSPKAMENMVSVLYQAAIVVANLCNCFFYVIWAVLAELLKKVYSWPSRHRFHY
jgi:hypothetical protein